jgi:hypothetical protein
LPGIANSFRGDSVVERPARHTGSPALAAICEPEWLDWYRLTPEERWRESMKLWDTYLMLGGSLIAVPPLRD